MGDDRETVERTIRIVGFRYTDPLTGRPAKARKHQTVRMFTDDAQRGEAVNAFKPLPEAETTQESEAKVEGETGDNSKAEVDPKEELPTTEEFAEWIKNDRPKINDVLAKAKSIELAERLAKAESIASEGKPRKTLIDALATIISRSA